MSDGDKMFILGCSMMACGLVIIAMAVTVPAQLIGGGVIGFLGIVAATIGSAR